MGKRIDSAQGPSAGARDARFASVRRRRFAHGDGWCILRTNSRRTLLLARSLRAHGVEAWSPQQTKRKRLPRSKGYREIESAIVPSFVFVRASQLPDVVRALALPVSPHPPFTIFQHAGRVPVVAAAQLTALEDAEHAAHLATLKATRPAIAIGAEVKPTEGAFAGLHGVVEEVHGGHAQVCFNGSFRVKVASWLLVGDDVQNENAHLSTAAEAA